MIFSFPFQLLFQGSILSSAGANHTRCSLLDCARICRYPCESFFYQAASSQCVLASVKYEESDPLLQVEGGWVYYSFTGEHDECAMGVDNCDPILGSCTNTVGSFTCACVVAGYQGDGVTCTDVNECSTGGHNCHAQATCTNTPGSFTCACIAGYTGDGVTSCVVDCPSPYQHVTSVNMCVRFVTTGKQYNPAKSDCASRTNGRVVKLDTTAKIAAIEAIHRSQQSGKKLWIGLNDAPSHPTGQFHWLDGTPVGPGKWKPGQPDNNPNDDCVSIEPPDDYRWVDRYCSDTLPYICEIALP